MFLSLIASTFYLIAIHFLSHSLLSISILPHFPCSLILTSIHNHSAKFHDQLLT